MSLLVAHGHSEAVSYPVGFLMDEASIVSERVTMEQGTAALLQQSVLATVPNERIKPASTRRAQLAFRSLIEWATGVDRGQQ